MDLENKVILKQQLKLKVQQAGYDNTLKYTDQSNHSLMCGELLFLQLSNGVSLHFGNNVESSNSVSSCEIEDLISFNILFSGSLSFAITDKRYTINATDNVKFFINTVAGKQPFSRFLNRQNHVKKLNFTVSRIWLEQRCITTHDTQFLSELFQNSHNVFELNIPEQLLVLTEQLLQQEYDDSIGSRMTIEYQSIRILGQMIDLLKNSVVLQNNCTKSISKKSKKAYEKEILKFIDLHYTVKQISNKLGTSERTLQRYFKHHFQMSVLEFVREKRLEKARSMILIERKSIGEAAYYSGYKHVSNFVTAFKKQFSITPSKLLEKHSLPK